jgi:3-deoxy-7-phosphoheptulonate synthase
LSSPHRKPAYKIVSRENRPDLKSLTATIQVSGVRFGSGYPVIIAGPCAVESREQTLLAAKAAKEAGAHMLRGGVFKTRTSPYDFQGLGETGLEILAEAKAETHLPVVTEVLEPGQVEAIAAVADMLQVGTRNMHNTPLLKALGRMGKPVLLKRGWASTVNEWLCAAEYIAVEGNLDIVLCERGIRIDPKGMHAHPTVDYEVVDQVRAETYLPMIIDPSHGTEDAARVTTACDLALAAGVDGLIIEILPSGWTGDRVKCDGHQSISPEVLAGIVKRSRTR